MDTKEKMETVATGAASNLKTRGMGGGGERPTEGAVESQTVEAITKDWPAMSKKAVEEITRKYGQPNEASPSRLIWFNTGPWKRTICYRDEIQHNFPQPHSDVVEQFIDYYVPPEKFTELAKFDGSIIVERTKGEVSSRCDMEPANILSINLMHEIVTGKLTAEEARQRYADETAAFAANRPAPYAETFQFEVKRESMIDPDEAIIGPSLVEQGAEKVKDAFRGERE